MKKTLTAIALFVFIMLAACSGGDIQPTSTPVDLSALQTAAVQTVVAEITETASAFTPTPQPTETPRPTDTPGPTVEPTSTENICDNAIWVADISYPDGTQVNAGQDFVKTWKVRNTGSCTWTTGYQVIYSYGDRLGGQSTVMAAEVPAGTEAEISVNMKAPAQAGTYSGFWRLVTNNGITFGETLTIVIVVP